MFQDIKLGNCNLNIYSYTAKNSFHNNEGLPQEVKYIKVDFNKPEEYAQIAEQDFDVIAQFLVFTPEEIKGDLAIERLLQKKNNPAMDELHDRIAADQNKLGT